jgi:two-component system OmpR family response regulator
LTLPKRDGRDVLRRLRGSGRALPVIILTARDSLDDRIDGLDLGADDYMVKPFEIRELLARMRAVLRRPGSGVPSLLSNGVVSLDPATHEAHYDGETSRLTAREFALLQALLTRPGAILSRSDLERHIYGWKEEVESNAIEFLIHAIRKKIGPSAIRNVRGCRMDGGPGVVMRSLRGRLFLSLTITIIVAGLGAGALAYSWAFDEAIELQDSILIQIGAVAGALHSRGAAPAGGGVDAEAQVVIEPLDGPGSDTQDRRSLKDLSDGLHTVARQDGPWRELIRTPADGSRIAIGQPTAIRDEIARDSALRTVVPLLVLIPCLMLIVAFVIRQTLRPVFSLAERLDKRQADDLQRLPLEGTPDELHPFIASINRLLERVQGLVNQQRGSSPMRPMSFVPPSPPSACRPKTSTMPGCCRKAASGWRHCRTAPVAPPACWSSCWRFRVTTRAA